MPAYPRRALYPGIGPGMAPPNVPLLVGDRRSAAVERLDRRAARGIGLRVAPGSEREEHVNYEEYADLQGLNATVLKEGRRSMKALQHRLMTAREDTIRLGLGRAAHCLILEPEQFAEDFVVWTGGDRRGKAWNEFCVNGGAGKTIIKASEYAHCRGMAEAVRAHPIAGPLMAKPGESEKVIQWQDPITGVDCKARLDRLTADEVIDIKTTADLDAHRFANLAARYGYHLQMAFYVLGLKVLGMERRAKLIAVEPLPPYDVAVFSLDEGALYAGEEEIKEILTMFNSGLVTGEWPGKYEAAEIPLELPAYCFPESDGDVLTMLNLNAAEEG